MRKAFWVPHDLSHSPEETQMILIIPVTCVKHFSARVELLTAEEKAQRQKPGDRNTKSSVRTTSAVTPFQLPSLPRLCQLSPFSIGSQSCTISWLPWDLCYPKELWLHKCAGDSDPPLGKMYSLKQNNSIWQNAAQRTDYKSLLIYTQCSPHKGILTYFRNDPDGHGLFQLE